MLVVDLQGGTHGHWGEILAVAAQHRGVTGLIVDGGVRDSRELAELAFPVFARMVTVIGTTKNYPGDFAVPVQIGDVTITPHDVVIADADAVIAVPANRLAEVVLKADQRTAEERGICREPPLRRHHRRHLSPSREAAAVKTGGPILAIAARAMPSSSRHRIPTDSSRWASAPAPSSATKTSSARGIGRNPSSSIRRS